MPHPCSFLGTFFIISAVVLLIFAHIGQISTGQKVPRSLRMVTLDTTGLGAALTAGGVSTADVGSLYANNQARTADNQGLRNYYEWGLWAYCASSDTNNGADYCTSTSFGSEFRPAQTLQGDLPAALSQTVTSALPDSTFVASNYTGTFTKIAFWLLFVGAILAGAAMLLSVTANRFGYILAALISFLAFICVAAGATIWTVIIAKVRNSINGTGTGLFVSYGDALWITWGATGALLFAVVPLFIACCTGRRDHDNYNGGMSEYGGGASQYGGSRRASTRGSKYEPSIRY